jgi:crossover junction endodeoxyribonuclease RuvC
MVANNKKYKILGIDPGFGRVGYGIIEGENSDWDLVDYGCIKTSAEKKLPERLCDIYVALHKLIQLYKPNFSAVEELFFAKNTSTAINVGQARGVIILALKSAGLEVREFTPLQIKQAMTGYGRAEKQQVQKMVQSFLKLEKKPVQDDAVDALAIALTCGVCMNLDRFIHN